MENVENSFREVAKIKSKSFLKPKRKKNLSLQTGPACLCDSSQPVQRSSQGHLVLMQLFKLEMSAEAS